MNSYNNFMDSPFLLVNVGPYYSARCFARVACWSGIPGAFSRPSSQSTALVGRFTDHHAFMLESLLNELEFLEEQIRLHDARIGERTSNLAPAFERLDTIPGVARRAAEQIVAELGDDMTRFPTPAHTGSWTGISPGNHESAGKRRAVRTTKGNRWLRATLVESARGAVRKRDCYLASQSRRLAKRRGDKRAIVAVAHSILVAAGHILHDRRRLSRTRRQLFDSLQREQLIRYHRRRLHKSRVAVEISRRNRKVSRRKTRPPSESFEASNFFIESLCNRKIAFRTSVHDFPPDGAGRLRIPSHSAEWSAQDLRSPQDGSLNAPRYFRAAETFQSLFEPSSDTRSEPSRATVTPTGRPQVSIGVPLVPLLARNPPRKSSTGPGLPLFIGKNTTL
jgi:hypothetical protein